MEAVQTRPGDTQFARSSDMKRSAGDIADDLAANIIVIDRLLNDAELVACIESMVSGAPEKETQDAIDRLLSTRKASAAMAAHLGRAIRSRPV